MRVETDGQTVFSSQSALNTPHHNSLQTAVPDQVAVTSTGVWTFIQSMIPQVVNAADFRTIQAFAESFESQAVFRKYPFS